MEHQFVRRMTTAFLCNDEPLMRANLRDHLQSLWRFAGTSCLTT